MNQIEERKAHLCENEKATSNYLSSPMFPKTKAEEKNADLLCTLRRL